VFKAPETYRIRQGRYGTTSASGNDGMFSIPTDPHRRGGRQQALTVISSDGMEWEHVSVSLLDRCPTWEEMDRVKRLFWSDDQTVMQLHVPRSRHVNNHPYCLHLWRPNGREIPLPPQFMV